MRSLIIEETSKFTTNYTFCVNGEEILMVSVYNNPVGNRTEIGVWKRTTTGEFTGASEDYRDLLGGWEENAR